MKKLFFAASLLLAAAVTYAQDTTTARALTMAEYEKAKTFSVGDPDKDTYVKIENTYILDHSGFGKPYFITGDDGKKKRIDLYKLLLKEGRIELGTIIYYTTENGKRYTACMPGYRADAAVWKKYFEDIHAIDKEEPFYVLKLSYVLSKELGFQLYRAAQPGAGTAINREAGTYGNDICFPGDMEVSMADGSKKLLSTVKAGDAVVTIDPATHAVQTVVVKELTVHAAKNYAITRLTLLSALESGDREVVLSSRVLEATPNHPMGNGITAGQLKIGDRVLCADGAGYRTFIVWDKTEAAGGTQPVYNIVAGGGSTLVLNGVMVMQK
ncbi:MAG TPA: Hint domain-containing protein [Puia sp.]|nr:Hint domain-containing protein [Puia sp.]